MVEILIGPEMIKRLWRKLFPKKVKTTATAEFDSLNTEVNLIKGIPDWVRKIKPNDSQKPLKKYQADPPQNDIIK